MHFKETEKSFQGAIVQTAKLYGWHPYHTWMSLHSAPGFPDLVLAKPYEALILAEVKRRQGELTKAQEEWIELLRTAKAPEVYIWRPPDWEAIEARLKRKL